MVTVPPFKETQPRIAVNCSPATDRRKNAKPKASVFILIARSLIELNIYNDRAHFTAAMRRVSCELRRNNEIAG
jgi:hypothetical protein